jgi:hypothetical protein
MSISSVRDADLKVLQEDLAGLSRDVTSLVNHLKLGASHSAQGAAEQLEEGGAQFYRHLSDGGQRSVEAVRSKISEQPLATVLIALGLGYLGGRLLPR